jgi:16S rRNA processing protein RimM
MQKRLEVGQIVNTFGIRGEVKVNPFTDDIKRFDELKNIYVRTKGESTSYQIENVKYHKNMVLLKLKGIDSIESAEKLRNAFLEIDREDAVPLEEGTYYIADLIGLEVYTDEGKLLGKVDDIYNTGGKDIYVVKDELGKQILLPGIEEVIKEVILDDKIIVHLIQGLI